MTRAASDATVTTVPWLCEIMSGRNSLTKRKCDRMLTANVFEIEASVDDRIVRPEPMPALLMRIVGCPMVERIEVAASATAEGSVISQV